MALGVAAAVVVLVVAFAPLARREPERVSVAGSPLYGQPAPEIDLRSVDGRRLRLSDLRGRPVLVNFWATWCIPCREEFPLMVDAYERHRDDGLEILGVLHDDDPAAARAFADDHGATWPILDDAQDVAWRDYLGIGPPQSYFVDANGVIQAFSLGPFTSSGLAAQLATIIPGGGRAALSSPAPG